ncbi:MAG: methylated-DNA--[Oscillibacter sp.]|nr:methylated-DNA--[protein]-cysteine S-methyltransferase [Oscillibacter sp.]
MYVYHYASPVGALTLCSDGASLTGLYFDGQKHFLEGCPGPYEEAPTAALEQSARWLDAYFAGAAPDFTPPLAPRGTPFRKSVWRALLEIPYGKTVTYGELARRLSTSARAVGGAVGLNPVSIVIPCHRVVGANGALTGYSAGVDIKARLLALERA